MIPSFMRQLPSQSRRGVADPEGSRVQYRVLAEGKREGLHAGFEEGDLEGAVGDGALLPDELVEPLLGDRAVALAVSVRSVGGTR